MTRVQWLQCGDPARMLKHLGDRASPRKLRLFGCACLRRIWDLLLRRIEDLRPLVELVERYADQQARLRDFGAWWKTLPDETPKRQKEDLRHPLCGPRSIASWAAVNLEQSVRWLERRRTLVRPVAEVRRAVSDAAGSAAIAAGRRFQIEIGRKLTDDEAEKILRDAIRSEWKSQADFLRCIFGTPFRSSSGKRDGLTPAVQHLARSAYEERLLPEGHLDITWLAVLADAIEEAGCTNTELLAHLHGPGLHVRGCWAVDLLLGKT